MARLSLVLAVTMGLPAAAVAQQPAVVWATDSLAPCTGVTVAFQADSARAQALVGPGWTVTAGKGGRVGISLFITRCPRSSIGGRSIEAATIAAVIVGVSGAPDSAGGRPVRAAAVPIVYGDALAPLTALFRSFAFHVRPAAVSIGIDSSASVRRVTFSVATRDGRIDGSIAVADTGATRAVTSRLVGTDAQRPSEFVGPEWSRQARVAATVRTTGLTLVSELGVDAMPAVAQYDTEFGWRFTFRMRARTAIVR